MNVELQAFCIEHNTVREAAALFQTVQLVAKQKEEGVGVSADVSTHGAEGTN